jgi:hypothetical protein
VAVPQRGQATGGTGPEAASSPAGSGLAGTSGRIAAIRNIVIYDLAGPLIAYALLRYAGLSAVLALVISGIFPAFGVLTNVIRNRRIDVIGILVLSGIVVGTVLGLASRNARLVLLEGSVPTAVLGVACLVSLRARRPLMFRFALELRGAGTERGREFAEQWKHEGFRRAVRLITVVWGLGFLGEAAARIAIVESTPTGTALVISKVLPYVFVGVLGVWTIGYGRRERRKGVRLGTPGANGHPPSSGKP